MTIFVQTLFYECDETMDKAHHWEYNLTISEAKGTRGKYRKYTNDDRLQIGKFAFKKEIWERTKNGPRNGPKVYKCCFLVEEL